MYINIVSSYSTTNTPSNSGSTATCGFSSQATTQLGVKGTSSGSASVSLPKDIAQTPIFHPVQPVNIKFPQTRFSNVPRSFNPSWYKTYSWLEYSVELDACFCYPCRLFGTVSSGSSRPEPTFTSIGFKDWKHATGNKGTLNGHSNSFSHKQAVIAWEQYKINSKQGTTISDHLSTTRAAHIAENQHYIKTIAEILLLCSRQEIGIRGHRESSESMNRGNFLELLHLVAKHDSVVQQRFSNSPKNAIYTSPDIQNDLIHIMASMVRSKICSEVKKAFYYSILADETKDCSKMEQLSIVVRYVNTELATIHEHFLTYVEAKILDAEALSTYILNTLQQNGLDYNGIVSQGYDGASVMSGCCSGVQQRIRQVVPQAIYVHCYAHCLNLVLVDTTKTVSEAAEFFAMMEKLYVFVSTSKVHKVYMEKQSELYPSKAAHQLKPLSDTRWACRFFSVEAVYSTFDAIVATLEYVGNDDDKNKAIEAKGILLQIQTFKFLITLILFWRILSLTKSLSDQLQSTNINTASAADLVAATIEVLQKFRSNEEWSKLYKYATDVASLNNISITSTKTQRQRKAPRRLDDVIVLESTGGRDLLTGSEDYKVSLYFPVLDAMIVELQRRFADKNLHIMRAIQSCNPESSCFLETNTLIPLAEAYGLDKESLTMECILAKRTLVGKDISSISDVLTEVFPLRAAFPTLLRVLQIGLTIVVSTAECERSFSALKRTKTYLRSSMSEQRLTDLAVLSIEKELSQSLSLDEVVQNFSGSDKNRRIQLA